MREKLLPFVIGLLPILMVLGNSMLIPILPDIEEDLHLGSRWSGFILSSFTIPAALVIPFTGILSDRYGRKRLISISLWIMILGSILCIFNGGLISLFMLGRGLQGVGAAGTMPLAMALIGDLYQGEERSRMLGSLEVFNGIGKVAAPLIGATLAQLVLWDQSFWVFPVISFVILVGLRQTVESTKGVRKLDVKEFSAVFLSKGRLLIPLYVIGGTGLFLLFGILFYLSYHIENTFHIDGFFKGFSFIFPLGAMTICSYWCGKRLKTDEELGWTYLKCGLITMSIPLGLLIFFSSLGSLMFFLTLSFGGLGLMLPVINTFITGSVSEQERGMVVSLYGAVRFGGVALGPVAFGVWKQDPTQMYIITFGFTLMNILLFALLAIRTKGEDRTEIQQTFGKSPR
ncbi:MFS transporter [Rossellomorea vietnamensis]|uniref:MFS transporter n=1 Tax=Rossellomorea vietnamensis TaxID=218284 RepID=UPI001CC9C8C3|nr:MFS transporter [Rossellomorea vietnamensis]MCA0147591.1 MFS transporter [Rossellomorea vietnamensis]